MLNTKLVRAGLLSIPILSIIAVNANYSQQPPDSISKSTTDTTVHWLQYDSISLKWTGTPATTEIEAPVIPASKQVKSFLDEYIDDNGYLLKKIKANNEPLFTIMDSVFTQQGLPVELKIPGHYRIKIEDLHRITRRCGRRMAIDACSSTLLLFESIGQV